MKFELIIREEGHANILRNALWWADPHSLSKAEEWMAEVYRQIDDLRTTPERHGLAREDSEFPFTLHPWVGRVKQSGRGDIILRAKLKCN
jgi:hypothetical protein